MGSSMSNMSFPAEQSTAKSARLHMDHRLVETKCAITEEADNQVNQKRDDARVETIPPDNGWDPWKQQTLMFMCAKLKYNYAISKFFYYTLKKKENRWSWLMIVLSTLTSSITLLNNIETEPFLHFFLAVKTILVIFSMSITLIAAWIKKQQYVERLNSIDRYIQKINILIQQCDMQCLFGPDDKIEYKKFKETYHTQIVDGLTFLPMHPKELKYIVYQISKYHPEIISPSDIDEDKLWPWYGFELNECNGEFNRTLTTYGKLMIDSYESTKLYYRICNLFSKNKRDFQFCCGGMDEFIEITYIHGSADVGAQTSLPDVIQAVEPVAPYRTPPVQTT